MVETRHICNMCGKEMDFYDINEHIRIYRTMGYGTKYDGDELKLDLCCNCIEDLIERCKVSPIIRPNHRYPENNSSLLF